jgi:hypothetical protein
MASAAQKDNLWPKRYESLFDGACNLVRHSSRIAVGSTTSQLLDIDNIRFVAASASSPPARMSVRTPIIGMAAIGLRQFHLLDREVPPATERRQQGVEIVNHRPNCRAHLTRKRAIENYLHPRAVQEVSSLNLTFGDDDDVADLVARACFERQDHDPPCEDLPGRAKKRCPRRRSGGADDAGVGR